MVFASPSRQKPKYYLDYAKTASIQILSSISFSSHYTGCPTTYQTRHFLNNSKTNEDIAKRFEQEYVRCVRNEEECVCSVCLFRCNIFIGFRIIKEMPGSVGSGTPYILAKSLIISFHYNIECVYFFHSNPV